MATYEGLVKLGTLRRGSRVIPRPTRPWNISTEPYPGAGVGNVADFTTDPNIGNWNIGDTDSNEANQLYWHKIKDGEKTLLICDRVILVNISWNDLNSDNRVFGKNVVIDGQGYKMRLLTAGAERREGGSGASYGGGKLPNEWDRFITNEDAITGIPVPTASDLDSTLNATDKSSAHNQFWNWMGVYSWGQETYLHNSAYRAIRGYGSARYWGYTDAAYRISLSVGWRPVLEVLNSAPSVTLTSPADNQTLVEGNIYEISGTASETDVGNVVTVKYKIDDGQTYNITAGVSDGTTPINFNKSLTYLNNRLYDGQTPVTPILDDQVPHTLKVWAEDDQGGKSTEETRNFTVLYNQPPQISGQDEDLGTITEPPSIQYSVTDIEGYAFTIKEAVDGNTIRTFPGVDGQQETVTIPQDMWIRLQPGVTHSLTITATDQYGATSTRTFTFIRTVDGIELMTTTILPADEQPSRVILSLNGSIPSNANLNIQVCNNAHDPSPTWEDMTDSVKNKRPYVFTNTTSTTGQWGIQFKISIMPGA